VVSADAARPSALVFGTRSGDRDSSSKNSVGHPYGATARRSSSGSTPNMSSGQGLRKWRIDQANVKIRRSARNTRDGRRVALRIWPDGKRSISAVTRRSCTATDRCGSSRHWLMRTQTARDDRRAAKHRRRGRQESSLSKLVAVCHDDGSEQPEEVKSNHNRSGGWFNGWYMPMTQTHPLGSIF